MPELNLILPDALRQALDTISGFTSEEFKEIVGSLHGLNPVQNLDEITESISGAHQTLKSEQIARVVLFSVSTRRMESTLPKSLQTRQTVSKAVAAAYASETKTRVSDELIGRISALLNLDFVQLREKSDRLANEVDAVLKSATTITDLRPIFSPSGDQKDLVGFVILNTIKLETESGGKSKTVYLQSDTNTLEILKFAAERAQAKSSTLSDLVLQLGLLNLTPNEGSDE